MSYTTKVAKLMLNRKGSLTIPQIASRIGSAEKTARNLMTWNERMDWVPPGKQVVVFHDGSSRRYAVKSTGAANAGSMKDGSHQYTHIGTGEFKSYFTRS